MLAYQAALAGDELCKPLVRRGAAGTFERLVQDYFESADYKQLTEGTQGTYRRIMEGLLREANIGHRLVAQMTRQHVQQIVAQRAETPAAANHWLKKLKNFGALRDRQRLAQG